MLTRSFCRSLGKRELTWEQVRAAVHYDPGSGIFVRIVETTKHERRGERVDKPEGKYRTVRMYARAFVAHRLVWFWLYGHWPYIYLDHKDTNGHNNRLENLRPANYLQNSANRNVGRNNKLGAKGVRFNPRTGIYTAIITIKGRNRIVGRAKTVGRAKALYFKAAKKLFGEFARA